HAIFLASVLQSDRFDVGFTCPEIQQELAGLEEMFAPGLPLHVDLPESGDLRSAKAAVARELNLLKKRGTYMLDLAPRYPGLGLIDPLDGNGGARTRYPLAIRVVESSANEPLGWQCNFHVQGDGQSYRWIYNQVNIGDDTALDLMRRFDDFLPRLISAVCSDECLSHESLK